MKRLFLLLSLLGAAGSLARAGTPLYITPDVPTTPAGAALVKPPPCLPGGTMLPWEIYRYTVPATYTCVFSVPGSPHIDAIQRLDTPGDWLFSVEAPSDLGGALLPLGTVAEPGDVIHYDSSAGTYTLCFDASVIGAPIPAGTNLDALYREGNGTGDMLVSFDVPVDLGAFPTFLPSDLVRFVKGPPPGAICPGVPGAWALAAVNPAFSGTAAGVALSDNVIGADAADAVTIFSFDVPADLLPGPVTYTPDEIVSFTAGVFALFEPLGGWVPGTNVDGLSCAGNPGVVPTTLTVNKTVSPGQLDLTPITLVWSASCSQGGEDYGIYEGTIGVWYSHTFIDCNDAGGNLTETVTPTAGNKYYLVVPHNTKEEGSYGLCSPPAACGAGNQRPLGGAVCATPQVLTLCPPP